MNMVSGSCLCRGVRWEIDGALEEMTHCHCSMCRKSHGTAFATYVAGPAEGFRWLAGEDLIRRFESSPGEFRGFCSRCGSVAPEDAVEGQVMMPAGNFDDDPIVRPVAHIFVNSKAAWHVIADDLPQFEQFAPGWEEPAALRAKPPDPTRKGTLRGSCLCGGVAYEVSGELHGVVKCHCSRCRKGRSAAHATNLFVTKADFRWLQGEELVERYRVPEAARFANSFCRTCGSIVPRGLDGRTALGIPAGGLDTETGVSERVHIYVGSKAPWYEITDALPQLEEAVGRRDLR
jgi:hypothetical protein